MTDLSNLGRPEGAHRGKKRLGRGPGSGKGKTSGKGHKGQKARTGHHGIPAWFEGGQMPIQRRLPKFGFRSKIAPTVAEVRLSELAKVKADVIDLDALKAANVVHATAERARIVSSGGISRAVTIKGLHLTKGAKAAVEAAGGKIEAVEAAK